jgi:25S rRNA (adenine2142-N1)-methyltransferase
MKSLKRARQVTSKFHRITHEIKSIEESTENRSKAQRLEALRSDLVKMGGREAYQQASMLTTARCSSSRWVSKCLRRRGLLGGKAPQPIPRLLEVGAINTELLSTPGLSVRSIDLLSSHPKIEQRDFFELKGSYSFDGMQYLFLVTNQITQTKIAHTT